MAYYRQVGERPAQAAHPAPPPRRRPVPRGADGRGGLLLGLLAALPLAAPLGDRRRPALAAARPVADAERPAGAAAPQAARPVPRRGAEDRRRGHRPPAGARQRRRPDLLRGPAQTRPLLPQRHRRRVRLRRARAAVVETVFGALEVGQGDYVILPRATTHRWVPTGASRCAPTRSRPTATSPRPSATCRSTGSCWSTRPTASATCAARPSRCWSRAPTSRSTSSTAATAPAGSPAPCTCPRAPVRRGRLGRLPLPLRLQRRRLRADHRPGAPAAAGAPGLRGHRTS